MVVLAKAAGPSEVLQASAALDRPWRIELFKSPLVVVLKHTVKRTRQTVHVDRLLPCNTPPQAVPEADSGTPTDTQTHGRTGHSRRGKPASTRNGG